MRLLLLAAFLLAATTASAAECPPDALGTSRILPVGTQGGLEIGLKTYPRTLPLADHEVILTFDDGPAPETTAKVLDALAAECVRATFFTIGRNVEAMPDLARRELREGHTVAHHTYTHPQPTLRYMGDAQARADIVRGMAAVEHALYGSTENPPPGDLAALHVHTPFFRFPGFADTADLRDLFAANNVGIFGTDLWASDWIPMTPEAELKLIMARLEKPKRGMILLHDSHEWTADMLPAFLRELKARGYKVVHIVPGPGAAATVDAPPGWTSETESIIGRLKPRLTAASPKPASPQAQ